MIENAYKALYLAVLICDAIAMAFTLIRCITGKRIVDRIICVNMMCNESTLAIAVLALYLKESYLLDVSHCFFHSAHSLDVFICFSSCIAHPVKDSNTCSYSIILKWKERICFLCCVSVPSLFCCYYISIFI